MRSPAHAHADALVARLCSSINPAIGTPMPGQAVREREPENASTQPPPCPRPMPVEVLVIPLNANGYQSVRNTGSKLFESSDIIDYLEQTYAL